MSSFRISLAPRCRGVRYYPKGQGKKSPTIEVLATSKKAARKQVSAYPYKIQGVQKVKD